jgi:hypothetical protein
MPPQLAASSFTSLPIILIRLVGEQQLVLLTVTRIMGIHPVNEVVVVAANLHKSNGGAKMLPKLRGADIAR